MIDKANLIGQGELKRAHDMAQISSMLADYDTHEQVQEIDVPAVLDWAEGLAQGHLQTVALLAFEVGWRCAQIAAESDGAE